MRRAVPRRVPAGSSVSRRLLPSPKKCALSLAISGLILSEIAAAGLEGGKIVGGAGNINHAGNTTTINQNTDRLAIDWQSFDVGSDERVNFVQPGSSSVALNRILSNYGSQINGRINANGHVVLVNPNGIVFGAGSVINAGGILASGLSIDPADFMNGDYTFKAIEGTDGVVINSGLINAATGGNVALIGKQVENQGLISAQLGTVTLAAGKEAVVTFEAGGILGVRVSQAVLQDDIGVDAAVINSGEINAEDGQILLSASVSQDIFSQAVNSGGLNHARSVVVHDDGSFTLGAGADVVNTGDLNVSGDNAGDIVVLGENIISSGRITADTLLDNASQSNSGGAIEIHSQDTTLLTQDSLTSATASSGNGGDIKVLGDKVGLTDNANLTASGVNGGGQILVGGDRTGDNPLVRNAGFIYLGEETNISADALINGDGGRVITFANNTARIYGDLSARGGAFGGDGGFIETSGLAGFEILNAPDISAVLGSGGEWLIDPHNITINDDGANERISSGTPFIASADDAILDVGILRTALSNNATVTIQTANPAMGSVEAGNITFDTNLNYTGNSNSTLVLNAHGNIDTNNRNISSSNNALNLEFNANFDSSSGNVILGASTINTNGGSFTVTADSFMSSGTISVRSNTGGRGGSIQIDTLTGDTTLNDVVLGDRDTSDTDALFLVNAQTINLNGLVTYGVASNAVGRTNVTFNASENIVIDNAGFDDNSGNDVLNLTLNADTDDSNNDGDITITNDTDIWLSGGDFSASGRNFTIGTAGSTRDLIGTEGGDIHIGTSDNPLEGDFSNDFDNAHVFSYFSTTQTGDINIYADGDIELGAIDISASFGWDYGGSEDVNINVVAGDDLTLHRDIPFDLIAGSGTNTFTFSAGNAVIPGTPSADQSASEIQVLANITSPDDSANVTFTTNRNRPTTFMLDGTGSNTGAFDALGSNLTITLNNSVTLNGGITTNDLTIRTDGIIQQTDTASSLRNDGVAIFNTDLDGNDNPFDITLTDANNDFNSLSLIIEDANNVSLNDFDRLVIGGATASNIFGNLSITAGEFNGNGIEDNGVITVEGTSSLTTPGHNIILDQTNFIGAITIDTVGDNSNRDGGNVTISGSDNVSLGTINTSGFSSSGDGGAGAIDITVNGIFSASGAITALGNGSGSNGNLIVNGDASDNTFTIGSSATWSGGTFTIDGMGQSSADTLIGPDRMAANDWQITSANGGTLNSDFGFTGIENLTGGTGQDDFVFANNTASVSGTINGAGTADGDTVSFAAVTTAVTAMLSDFLGIESITGSNAALSTFVADNGSDNTWNIDGTDSGDVAGTDFINFDNITGGSGDDTFTFVDGGSISGNIDGAGQTGNDTVTYASVTTAVTADLNRVSNVEIITGNAVSASALVGADRDNTWNITGANSGNLDGQSITFTSFNNITGGSQDDDFVFDASGNGDINGGIDGASQNSRDTVSYTNITDPVSVVITDFTNIERVIGNGSNSTFQGDNVANTWTINGANQGDLNGFAFEGFNILTGGSNVDSFVFMDGGSITSADAGTQSGLTEDVVDLSNRSSVGITVGTTVFGVTNFEHIIGNYDDSSMPATGNSTLRGTDIVNAWAITDVNDGNVNGTFAFTDFNNLVGGTANDTFTISDGADVTGTIDGGGTMDNDTVNYAAVTGAVSIMVSDFTNIEGVVGNNTNSTLTGANTVNTWTITSENDGDLNDFEFINFNHLVGGSEDDTFVFMSDASVITGSVDAGGQATSGAMGGDVVDISRFTTVNVNAAAGLINNVANAERVIGNGTTSTLNGGAIANTWNITGEDDGDINGLFFEDFNILVGGDNDDTFVFMNAMSSVTSANAGGQATGTNGDTVDLSNLTNANIVASTTVRGVSNIEHVIGDNSTSILTGGNTSNSWTIDGTNAGSVSGITFAQFNQLAGGTGDDTFIFMDTGSITGVSSSIDAGGQASQDTVDLSSITSAINENVGSTIFGVTNVERVIGNNTNSTLTGANTNNTWSITSANSGNVNSDDLVFVNFNNLVGGNADDDFNFTTPTSSIGSIDGGAHTIADTADYRNTAVVDLTLGVDIDNIESVVGNTTDSTLRSQDIANVWTIDGANAGNINSGISFTGFSNLFGGANDDTFVFMDGGSIAGAIDAGNQASQDTVDLSNLTGAVSVIQGSTIFGVSGAERLIGNNTNTTLTAINQINTWNINGQNDGSLSNTSGTLAFVDVSDLVGGSNDDSFTVTTSGSITGTINGGVHINRDEVTYQSSQDITLNTNLINIEQITAVDSILRTDNSVNNWLIDGEDTGTINGVRFIGFDRVFGGTNDDTFEFTSTGNITGSIDAGDHNIRDTVNLAALSSVDITLGGNVNGVANVEQIIGNGSQSNLRAASGDNVWTISGENDGSVAGAANIEFEDFNNLFGSSGDDTFNFQAMGIVTGIIDGGLQSTQDAINYASVGVVDIAVGDDFVNIERVEGNNINSTFTAADQANTWVIDNENEGTVNSIRFVSFNFLVGNNQQDNFRLSGGSITGSIDGGLNTDTLTADASNNTWTVTGDFEGSVTGVASFLNMDALIGNSDTDIFNVNSNYMGRIEGGGEMDTFNLRADVAGLIEANSGDDQFNIFVDGLTASINGNDDSDTLTIRHNAASDWMIQGGGHTVDNVSFDGIEIANGNDNIDDVNISTSFGEINTAGGADTISIATSNAITTTINAGGGSDTLTSLNTANTWLIGTDNTLNTSIAFTDVQTFVGGDLVDNFTLQSGSINGSINGGGNTDSLTVNSVSADTVAWNITGDNVGAVTGITGGFESIESLAGGEGTDTFIFTDTASDVSGLIDGGGSASDSLDLSVLTAGVVVELGSTVTSSNPDTSNTLTNLHVNNIETLTAANDTNEADGNDTEVNNWLTSSDNVSLTWTVTERNGGQIFPTSNPAAENTVNFANFGTIIGGEGDDTFGLVGANAEITGSINGGGGDNRLDFSRVADLLVVTIGDDISGTLNISNVQGVTGNNNAILRIDESDTRTNTWTIDGTNRGRVETEANGPSDFTFTAFNNLVGGGGQDLFNFTGAGNIEGTIEGGGIANSSFVDTINATASGTNLQVQLSEITQAMLGDGSTIDVVLDNSNQAIDIFEIGRVIGGATQTNTLIGQSASNNTWVIDGLNAGEVNSVVFSNFSNLTGGSAQDQFTLNNNDSITGVIDGGAGNNDLLDIIGLNNDVSVALGIENVADLNVVAIENIDANTGNNNTIIGENSVNRWVINGTNDGQLGSLVFTGFANLTGGNLNDTFVLDGSDSITGVIDGGAEPTTGSAIDELDINGLSNDVAVALETGISADINAVRFENINANTVNDNTIVAANTENAWQLNAQNGGVINGTVTFAGFDNLQGGSQNDTFEYLVGGLISGNVNGGSQAVDGRDVVDMSALDSVRIRIGDSSLGFSDIEEFRGNNTDSELTAENVRNDWVLDPGNNSGVINANINFSGFNILIGGSGVDNFNVANGSVDGEIRAGAGNDTLTVDITDGVSGNVSFVGNDGTDTVTVRGGSASERYTTSYQVSPTNGRSTLEYTRTSASTVTAYSVNYSESESVNDQVFSDQLVVNDIDGQVDIFNLADGNFNLNSFAQVDYLNKENIRVLAETGDTVNVNGLVQIANTFELVNASVNAVGANAQIQAAEVIFNGTGAIGSADDRLSLNTGRLSLQTVVGDVFVSEENDLQISSILNPTGSIDIEAGGSITDEGVLASNQAVSITSTLGNITLDNANSLAGDINLSAVQGNVSLNNNRATQLGNINTQTLTVTSAGTLTDSNAIQVSGLTTINAGNNAVELNSTNNDFGSIVVENASQLTLNDVNDIIVRQSNASGTFNVQAGGALTADGAIQAADIILSSTGGSVDVGSPLVAQNSIALTGQGVTVNGNIETQVANGTNAIAINAGADSAQINAQVNATGADVSVEANTITQQSGSVINGRDVNLIAANGVEQNGNISGTQTIQIIANGGDINTSAASLTQGNTVNLTAVAGDVLTGQITAEQLNIQSIGGNVNLAVNTRVNNAATINSRSAQINGDVNVTGNFDLTTSETTQLQSGLQAGQVNITAGQQITMGNGSVVTGGESISLSANDDITLTQLVAQTGNVTLVSNTGGVTSVVGSDTNIQAADLTVTTETGVGSTIDALDLSVARLTLNNNQGTVALVNDQEIHIAQLRSNNNVSLVNSMGDVVLDNAPDQDYMFDATDARIAGGDANANFDVGVLTITVPLGGVRATGSLNSQRPDLVGNSVVVSTTGGFGANGRPIVVLAKEELVVNGPGFFPIFTRDPNTPFSPGSLTDLSTLVQGRNDLLVNVESAEEIDPAVFTGVRNYSYDNVSIRLPIDQLFEEDEELDEEEDVLSLN